MKKLILFLTAAFMLTSFNSAESVTRIGKNRNYKYNIVRTITDAGVSNFEDADPNFSLLVSDRSFNKKTEKSTIVTLNFDFALLTAAIKKGDVFELVAPAAAAAGKITLLAASTSIEVVRGGTTKTFTVNAADTVIENGKVTILDFDAANDRYLVRVVGTAKLLDKSGSGTGTAKILHETYWLATD